MPDTRNYSPLSSLTPQYLASIMGFTDRTMQRYLHDGQLQTLEREGETLVRRPGRNWHVLKISAYISDVIAGRKHPARRHLWCVPLLTTRSASQLLHVSQRRVQKMISDGTLPAVRLGERGHYRVSGADVARCIRRRLDGTTPAKVAQAKAQLQVIRRLARARVMK